MNVLITAPYNQTGLKEVKSLFGGYTYRCWKENGRAFHEDELISLLKETKAEGLIAELDKVTEKVFESVPELKFVGVCRGMPSNVNIEAASKRGIPVFYTPARNAQAVAEQFIGNLITFYRHTIPSSEWLKKEKWDGDYLQAYVKFKGNEISGKTIGLVGFGAVGRKLANILKAFDCHIHYYDPYVESDDSTYTRVSLDEVFSSSDVVSIHLPRTDETIEMIDEYYLGLMREDAVLVNTSRAVVVKRDALVNVLKEGKIRGAILDVFYHEPPDKSDYEIIQLPNVLATPHLAGASFEVEDHHVSIMNQALVKWSTKQSLDIPTLFNRKELQVKS
ncbi:2-hydroxyacid dehydrogenase [Metabacillus halosaccharovorans]|uniref:2-hydroxyacid dehydrogenase n=1 Tax=Metabacillus halosaccharovorans TaxID=930124 RepID=UPI001C1F9DEC|nr:2-hydroxyacid dehydrogenase [Metabacillus halosaccharovorans]MBU7591742.1 2-hydroxyacid dehydrogenase [Metabacillus halosaccharovorans]